ncbi:hypothetical protein PUN28_002562 [Cardiocondyla obscurior]|uniref:Uncharacterized protein n=1 Tax=Cardiocondyla obscurior TaxID=286306 RepID=A0AAW2GV53_9HYME
MGITIRYFRILVKRILGELLYSKSDLSLLVGNRIFKACRCGEYLVELINESVDNATELDLQGSQQILIVSNYSNGLFEILATLIFSVHDSSVYAYVVSAEQSQ